MNKPRQARFATDGDWSHIMSERILITAVIALPLIVAVAWLVQAIGGKL